MNIRSVDFKISSMERLAKRLKGYYASIKYHPEQEVLAVPEGQAYNPGIDVLSRNFGTLTDYFNAEVSPILREAGASLGYTALFRAITRTYRSGDHQDYWLVHSELVLKFHKASLFRTLMRFDENGLNCLPLDLEGRAADRHWFKDNPGNFIPDPEKLKRLYLPNLE